jgi:hypothetical protein
MDPPGGNRNDLPHSKKKKLSSRLRGGGKDLRNKTSNQIKLRKNVGKEENCKLMGSIS